MADGAGFGLELYIDALPVLGGAWEMLEQGVAPGATQRNLEYYGSRVEWGSGVTDVQKQLVADPQTSGGLLFAVEAAKVDQLVAALNEAGAPSAAVVGRLTTESGVRIS
jgi:selenide,water dikinase